jgi:hypothetical protein
VSPVHLVASPDDYLLELEVDAVVDSLRASLDGAEPEVLGAAVTPEELAVELCSPSLFAAQRILVAPEIASWLDVTAQKQPRIAAKPATVDATALVQVLESGVGDGIALVMGACCHAKPKGALASAVEKHGELHWQPTPEAPKPWEDLLLSKDQERLLDALLERTAGGVAFAPAARKLLFERLGFAPRALASEVRKLAAASSDGRIDEELVRALSFPRERSIEVVDDAIFGRRVAPVLDLMAAARGSLQVRDWNGQAVDNDRVPQMVFSRAVTTLQQLLYLRRVAASAGFADEMAPERTGDRWWYPQRFSKQVGPALVARLEADAPSPLVRAGSKPLSMFRLGGFFKGAGRYGDAELVDALAAAGPVERALRGDLAFEAVSVWLAEAIGAG